MLPRYVTDLIYLIAAAGFIYGLHDQAHPRSAQRGSALGAVAMLLAVVVTLLDRRIVDYTTIAAGLVLGGAIGMVVALRTPVTALPQLVALRNAFGGAVAVLIAAVALLALAHHPARASAQFIVASVVADLIGGATLGAGLIAFGKLQGILTDAPVRLPGTRGLQALLLLACVVLGALLIARPEALLFWLLLGAVALLGVLIGLPISGTDMPVVIALLTSCAGLAAAANGFMLPNTLLLISGALVGASGIVLTRIMCRGMNRSLGDVLFRSGVACAASGPSADEIYAGKVKSATADEIAMVLDGARRVVIVPGYGMAVAQAQHAVRDLANEIARRGASVEYAIHPVAGRMPGQMNVLLAEADVPYEEMKELEAINPTMDDVDVAIVIGANDIVNPLARTDPQCPIAGMPIIDVDRARSVVVVKRSLSHGFAGIPNPLFAADRTLMFFADGKQAIRDLLAAIKET
jgi:NAD(P) transhydrogenase subunit beta